MDLEIKKEYRQIDDGAWRAEQKWKELENVL